MVEALLTPQCGRSLLTPPFQILDFFDKELVRLDQHIIVQIQIQIQIF